MAAAACAFAAKGSVKLSPWISGRGCLSGSRVIRNRSRSRANGAYFFRLEVTRVNMGPSPEPARAPFPLLVQRWPDPPRGTPGSDFGGPATDRTPAPARERLDR